jgi:hypothetical protein
MAKKYIMEYGLTYCFGHNWRKSHSHSLSPFHSRVKIYGRNRIKTRKYASVDPPVGGSAHSQFPLLLTVAYDDLWLMKGMRKVTVVLFEWQL